MANDSTPKPSGVNITELSDYFSAVTKSPADAAEPGAAEAAGRTAKVIQLRAIKPDEDGGSGGRSGGLPPGGAGGTPGEAPPVWASDDSLAMQIKRAMGGLYCYVPEWKCWMKYDETLARWREDSLGEAIEVARRVCREVAGKIDQAHLARSVSSDKTIKAALRLASSGEALDCALAHTVFDADGWLLGTPAGPVDLRSGQMLPPSPDHYLTKSAAAIPIPLTRDPKSGVDPLARWHKFLEEFASGNEAEISYLQRVAGYCAVGVIREHLVIVLYGVHGGEGKGVFLRVLARVLGDYAKVAMAGMFEEQKGERHPTELADLEGARMIISTETQKGAQWNEPRLKQFSGGDRVSARRMRGDPFEYCPVGKLLFAVNHKPRLLGGDGGIERRLQMMECLFVPPKPDRDLEDKLWEERDAILSWIIEGAQMWRVDGLQPPASVVAFSQAYLREQDVVSRYVWDRCLALPIDAEKSEPFLTREELWADYNRWAAAYGERVLSRRRFYEGVARQRGVRADRGRQDGRFAQPVRGFLGLAFMAGLATPEIVAALRAQRAEGKDDTALAHWLAAEHKLALTAAQVAQLLDWEDLEPATLSEFRLS
jgi:putative DNA primase/helicase